MRKGGYRIINLKGAAFTSGKAANVVGAYEATNNPYGKATMISGLVVSNVEYPDFYAPFIASSGKMTTSVVIGGSTITIAVSPTDDITVTVS